MQIGFNKYNVYFTNSYYRFDSNFIRFSLFILSTKGVKPYLCRIKSNFAPDMTQVKMKIMSWKNGLLLSAVSYVFYLVMWFILDDKTIDQLPGMTIADYMVDFLLCMLFYLHILRILFSGLQGIAVQDILRVGNGLCILPNGTEQYRCVRYDNLVQFPMGRNRQRAS